MKTGANIFLTGEPGSGKTHTVNAYIRYLRDHGVHPSVTASTGIAATHVGGMTIHAWSGIGIRRALTNADLDALGMNEPLSRRVSGAKVLIIDEVSMMDGKILTMVEAVCRSLRRDDAPFGGLQVIFVGDFFQLPPIAGEGEALPQFCFFSRAWKSAKPVTCYLSEQHRQEDTLLLSTLSAIRSGELEDHVYENLRERTVAVGEHPPHIPLLFTHNADVDEKNNEELVKISEEEHVFAMNTRGRATLIVQMKKGCLSPETLVLKKGASVMFTRNNFEAGYVNGTLGVVEGFDEEDGYPMVTMRSGTTVKVTPASWAIEDDGRVVAELTQVPLRLAWAITVHKSQGMSIDSAVMDLSRSFEYGQGYVALSRVRSLSGLHILGINQRALLVHPTVLEHDARFREESDEAEQAFSLLPESELATIHQNFLLASGGSVKKEVSADRKKNKPERIGARWEGEEEERLTQMWKDGKKVKDIAGELKRQPGGVRSRLKKLGLVE